MYNMQLIDQNSLSFNGFINKPIAVVLEIKNTGAHCWSKNTKLGILNDKHSVLYNYDWPEKSRSMVCIDTKPGEIMRFEFDCLPKTLGTIRETFKLVEEGRQWFGDEIIITFNIAEQQQLDKMYKNTVLFKVNIPKTFSLKEERLFIESLDKAQQDFNDTRLSYIFCRGPGRIGADIEVIYDYTGQSQEDTILYKVGIPQDALLAEKQQFINDLKQQLDLFNHKYAIIQYTTIYSNYDIKILWSQKND